MDPDDIDEAERWRWKPGEREQIQREMEARQERINAEKREAAARKAEVDWEEQKRAAHQALQRPRHKPFSADEVIRAVGIKLAEMKRAQPNWPKVIGEAVADEKLERTAEIETLRTEIAELRERLDEKIASERKSRGYDRADAEERLMELRVRFGEFERALGSITKRLDALVIQRDAGADIVELRVAK